MRKKNTTKEKASTTNQQIKKVQIMGKSTIMKVY